MWKYKSSDFEHFSLHDHSIDEIQPSGNDILLIFKGGFDIYSTHPLNDTGKHKHTTASQIILRNASFTQGSLYRWDWQDAETEQKEFDLAWLIKSPYNFEILDSVLNFKAEDETVALYGRLVLPLYEPDYKWAEEQANLSFSCNGVVFCWNDYSGDAWFEGWPESAKYNVD